MRPNKGQRAKVRGHRDDGRAADVVARVTAATMPILLSAEDEGEKGVEAAIVVVDL